MEKQNTDILRGFAGGGAISIFLVLRDCFQGGCFSPDTALRWLVFPVIFAIGGAGGWLFGRYIKTAWAPVFGGIFANFFVLFSFIAEYFFYSFLVLVVIGLIIKTTIDAIQNRKNED